MMNNKILCALLLLSLFLLGAGNGEQDRDERGVLSDMQATLRARIKALRNEQDYLLFRNTMYRTDSKYLVINITKRTGQLKYKNRLLKDFRFRTSKNFHNEALRTGIVVLTKKVEGKNGRHALVFGKSFIVQWKRSTADLRKTDTPYISVTRKELSSIFYAVEEGSMAYIER